MSGNQRGEGESSKKPRKPKYDRAKSGTSPTLRQPGGSDDRFARRRETRPR